MFNVNRRNNQFLYASTVIEGEALPQALFFLTLTPTLTLAQTLHLSLIINIKEFHCYGIPTITPGAYDLTDIAELIKEETDGNVLIEPDKNTMKCLMEIKQGAISFDVENSTAPLLGFRKIVYKKS